MSNIPDNLSVDKAATPLPLPDHGRNDVIDIFRALSILSVMAFHYLVPWKHYFVYDTPYSPFFQLGRYGVYVFFVISGIVISMTVLRSASAADFLMRRFARLYPAYFIAASLAFLALSLWGPLPERVSYTDYLLTLPLLAKDLHRPLVDGIYWTLVVEAKFYLFVALFYFLFKERFWMGLVAIGVLDAFGILRGLFLGEYLAFFLLGMSAYFGLFNKNPLACALTGILAAVLYVVYFHYITPTDLPTLYTHLYLIGMPLLMIALLAFVPNLQFRPLAYLGRISYSLYLVHSVVGVLLISWFKSRHFPDVLAWGCAALISLLLAALSFHFIEQYGQEKILSWWRSRRGRREASALTSPGSAA